MGIYENIKKAANMRNTNINQIEQALSLPRSSIAKFNEHSPSSDKLYAIASYLRVPMETLMGVDIPAPEAKAQVNNIFHSLPPNETYTDSLQDAFNDSTFMQHIALLWALHEEDRKAIYRSIKGLYYAAKEEKEKEAVLRA